MLIKQRGTSLIEVMVSVFVFSVGLIGVAKLQVVSKQNNFDAVQRVTASTLANDMVERMRANPTNLLQYVSVNGSRTINSTTFTTEPTPVCDDSNNCTGTQLAAHELWEFKEALIGAAEKNGTTNTGGIDEPTACISGPNDGSAAVYTVAIAWRGRMALSNPGINACGDTSGLYGTNNEYRRIMVVQTFIDNQ